MSGSAWERYVELRDKLEAIDRLPRSSQTDGWGVELLRQLRDYEELYCDEELEERYNDPEKLDAKERQITSYQRIYECNLVGDK